MDEELFTEEAINRLTEYARIVVDIKTYTMDALKLQMAVIVAEDALDDACQQQREAKAALDDAKAKLQEHLDIIRKTHVTLRKGRHE